MRTKHLNQHTVAEHVERDAGKGVIVPIVGHLAIGQLVEKFVAVNFRPLAFGLDNRLLIFMTLEMFVVFGVAAKELQEHFQKVIDRIAVLQGHRRVA